MAGARAAARTACARVLVRGGVDERTGEALTAAAVAERVAWCAGLVSVMTAGLLEGHWNSADVAALASGKGPDGRPLPARSWMALRRLGWDAALPGGVVVNDRVMRMAQEQAGRVLRSAAWRAGLAAGVIATWPADPGKRTPGEWDAVRAAVPGGEHVPSSVIRARTRQVARYLAANGRMPRDVFELEPAPRAVGMLVLAACDRQQATLQRHGTDPRRALLRLQLPVRPDPRSYRDWSWVAVPLALPPTAPAGAALHLPVLRVEGGRVRAEVPFSHLVPATRRDGHVVAIGVDWGLNTLLSAGAVRLNEDGAITALRHGAQYRAAGVLAKAHRLRRQGERLHAKISQYERLTAGRDDHPLAAPLEALREEARHVASRRAHLNGALAASAARWAIDQALAAGATVAYVEDLRTLEARGMGKTLNTRLSQAVRGQIVDRMRHLAAEHGIAVVTVPPRGTSKRCPRCLAPLRHSKAPDQPTQPGWKWASCPSCGWQGDRDTGAWRRIAARGLTHQARTATHRKTAAMTVRAVDDALEAVAKVAAPETTGKDRSKAGPTRKRTSRRVPRRRTAPPTPPPGGVQRPGGTRRNGPATASRSDPGPGRDHDRLHPRLAPPPGARSGTRRGLSLECPRHTATGPILSSPQGPLRITKPIRDAAIIRGMGITGSAKRLTGSTGSILSIGSSGSILSIGSSGSILSMGSAGSILSIGSVASAGSIFSVYSAGSIGSVLSGLSRWSVLAWRSTGADPASVTSGKHS